MSTAHTDMVGSKIIGAEANLAKAEKLSQSARFLLDRKNAAATCRVNVLVGKGLSEDAIRGIVKRFALAGAVDVEVRPRMAMIHATVPVPALTEIAEIDQVSWVDTEKSAPLESVLD